MRDINLGDTVVKIDDIQCITEVDNKELYIDKNIDRYKVIDCDDRYKELYYHIKNINTNKCYYILKNYVIKIDTI